MSAGLIVLALTLAAAAAALLPQNVRADFTYADIHCDPASGNYTDGGAFQTNLGQVVSNLTDHASGNAFFSNITAGEGGDRVFGLYYCNGMMDAADCSACVEAAAGEIQDSCTTREAIVWYLECTLRYAERDIFSKAEVTPYAHLTPDQKVSNRTALSGALATAVPSVIKEAASSDRVSSKSGKPPAYAAVRANLSSTETLVAVAQCTPDIAGPGCSSCLKAAATNLTSCCSDRGEAMVFLPSCQLLYTVSSSNSSAAAPSPHLNPFASTGKSDGSVLKSRACVIAGVSAALGFLLLLTL